MANIHVKILSDAEIQTTHDASLSILKKTGIMIHHDEILKLIGQAGARVNKDGKIARLPEQLVMDCITKAKKQYVLYGRDLQCTACFGYGDLVLMSSPDKGCAGCDLFGGCFA
jgi:trimethylamine--corrinoid protein Co-methyltransferase